MFKNVAGQSIALFAFDKTSNSPKTGDAGNISTFVAINYGSVSASGNTVTEWNSIKSPGWYILALSQAETNGDELMFTGTSSTANILLVGRPITTLPPNFTALSISGGAVTAGTVSDKTGYSLTGTQTFNNTGTWTGNVVGTVSTLTTYTGNTPQTGDSFARIGAAGAGLTAVGLTGTQTFSNTGTWTGSLTGSVGSVTGAVGSVTGLTASDIGAIKTKTDQLTFTVANKADVNIKSVNNVTVTGAGTSGSPWGP